MDPVSAFIKNKNLNLFLFVSYLIGSEPRCYNATDPYLNSTAWFANSIGNFVKFLTLGDLTSFVSTTQVCCQSKPFNTCFHLILISKDFRIAINRN